MIRVLVAAITIALLASGAFAQDAGGFGGGKGGKGRKSQQNTEQQNADKAKQKAADEAYQAAVKKIPDPKEKYDPWKIVR